jgi:hypothetical protein
VDVIWYTEASSDNAKKFLSHVFVPKTMSDGRKLPESERQCLSPNEFVAATGLSLSTVHRLLAKKQLPKDQPGAKGTRILIPIGAVDAFTPKASDTQIGNTTRQLDTDVAGERGRLSGRPPLWISGQRANKT